MDFDDFKPGDQVRLLSGGPVMTVKEIDLNYQDEPTAVVCQWFAGKKLDSGRFQPASLEKVSPDNQKKS